MNFFVILLNIRCNVMLTFASNCMYLESNSVHEIDIGCWWRVTGYRRQVVSSTGRRHVTTTMSSMSVGGDTVEYLLSKPLFWMSVVSLCISAVATTVLVVLCVCRRLRPSVTQRRRQHVHSTAPPRHKLSQLSPASTGQIRRTISVFYHALSSYVYVT